MKILEIIPSSYINALGEKVFQKVAGSYLKENKSKQKATFTGGKDIFCEYSEFRKQLLEVFEKSDQFFCCMSLG